jgi:ABC-2 type transport system ATP-binding protein
MSGAVYLDGRPAVKMRRHIYFLPEIIEVPGKAKAREYVEAVASFYGGGDAAEALEIVEMPGELRLEAMSQGMKRLVQLAAAFAVLPKVRLVVLDDPYVSVAPDVAQAIHRELLRRAKGQVLVITARAPLEATHQIDFTTLKPKKS